MPLIGPNGWYAIQAIINAGYQMLTIIIDINKDNFGKHDNFPSHLSFYNYSTVILYNIYYCTLIWIVEWWNKGS